jgi:hypothetical protein
MAARTRRDRFFSFSVLPGQLFLGRTGDQQQ